MNQNFENDVVYIRKLSLLKFLSLGKQPSPKAYSLGHRGAKLRNGRFSSFYRGRIVPASIDRKLVNNDDVPHGGEDDIFSWEAKFRSKVS